MFDQSERKYTKIGGLTTPAWEDPSEDDAEIARATIDYIRNEWENDTDFGHNVTTVIADDQVKHRSFGIAAAAVMVYKRDQEKAIEQEKAKAGINNEHVGSIKDRTEFKLTVTGIKAFEGQFGTTFLHSMIDEDGHIFKWFGSYDLDEGKTYTGKWTIKDHDEWKGMKQTIITRPAKVEEVS
jgi:hypothetical protein